MNRCKPKRKQEKKGHIKLDQPDSVQSALPLSLHELSSRGALLVDWHISSHANRNGEVLTLS